MPSPAAKLSISIPQDLASAVRRRVGVRGLSSFVARAISHELEREQLSGFISELEADDGAVSKQTLAAARRAWPKR